MLNIRAAQAKSINHLLILGRALAEVLLLAPCCASNGLLFLCQGSLPRTQLCRPFCAGGLNSMPLLRNALGLFLSCSTSLFSWHGRPVTLQGPFLSAMAARLIVKALEHDKISSSCQAEACLVVAPQRLCLAARILCCG